MALQLKSSVSQNQAGTELYIEVVTATGVYNASTNPGGFGAPNPTRNEVALLFYGLHKKVPGDVEAIPLAYNALTVTSFTIELNDDNNGILDYHVFPVLVFNPVASYDDGDIVYDVENPSAPFIKKRILGQWQTLQIEDLLQENVEGTLDDVAFPIPRAIAFKDELNAKRVLLLRPVLYDGAEPDDYLEAKDRYDFVDGTLDIATKDFCAGAFNEAQIRLEAIFTLQDTIKETNG